jgi:DtxR family Mn-dependent transcriptional regulator
MTTTSAENYLKAIRELCDAGGRVTTCTLARHFNIAPASVTNMVQRLAAEGLLDYAPYSGVKLTEAGEREAAAVLRRHEIIERYLINTFGFDEAQAHAEAERLEHVVSPNLVQRMRRRTSRLAARA